MNTTQLECFLAVAEHLNFSRASEELKMTQPAVSHQIRTLEEELGVKLFTARGQPSDPHAGGRTGRETVHAHE